MHEWKKLPELLTCLPVGTACWDEELFSLWHVTVEHPTPSGDGKTPENLPWPLLITASDCRWRQDDCRCCKERNSLMFSITVVQYSKVSATCLVSQCTVCWLSQLNLTVQYHHTKMVPIAFCFQEMFPFPLSVRPSTELRKNGILFIQGRLQSHNKRACI